MKITLRASSGRTIAATGQTVEPGGTVEVSDELGSALCVQSDVWREAKPAKATKENDR